MRSIMGRESLGICVWPPPRRGVSAAQSPTGALWHHAFPDRSLGGIASVYRVAGARRVSRAHGNKLSGWSGVGKEPLRSFAAPSLKISAEGEGRGLLGPSGFS
jgi:hypothetical protein